MRGRLMAGRRLILPALVLTVAAMTAPLHAQAPGPAFTTAQAARGAVAYQSKCQECHGATLYGSEAGPPLIGGFFSAQWGGSPVGDLFDVIRTTMPATKPGTLAPSETADIVAYILCSNGVTPSATPLAPARPDLDAKIGVTSAVLCPTK